MKTYHVHNRKIGLERESWEITDTDFQKCLIEGAKLILKLSPSRRHLNVLSVTYDPGSTDSGSAVIGAVRNVLGIVGFYKEQ